MYVLGIEMNIRHIIGQGVLGSVVGRSGVGKMREIGFGRHVASYGPEAPALYKLKTM